MQSKISLKAGVFLIFLFAGLTLAMAYGTSNPAVFGHSAGEIDFTGMSGNVQTTGDVRGARLCIGNDCRTAWPTVSGASGADPNSNVNINGIWTFSSIPRFNDNIRFTAANKGIVFYGGGEAITGSADYGIDFKSQNGQVRMKVNNDGRVEVFDRLCLGGSCISSWPSTSSSATVIDTTVSAINSASGKSMSDGETQWMITGGHRFCVSKGYVTGTVVEYYSTSAQVACYR